MKRSLTLLLFCATLIACATAPSRADYLITEPILITPKAAPDADLKPEERDYNDLFALANDRFDAGDLDTASRYYHDILTHNPAYRNAPFCYYNLGLIALKRHDHEKAQAEFKAAYFTLGSPADKADALLLRLYSLSRLARWEEIADDADAALSGDLAAMPVADPAVRETLLRRAEARAMLGAPEEARRTAQYVIFEIRREHPPRETFFIPELALAYFVMGRAVVAEFAALPFDATLDRLVAKCTLIQEAQRWFLQTIQVGVIYWTNAAAYELAALYRALFDEMNAYPVPDALSGEERAVYACELWEKTAGLLRKARRTLAGSIESAKRIHEQNEFIDDSLRLLIEVNAAYAEKDSLCRPGGLTP